MAANLVDVAFLSLGCKVNQVEKSAWQCQIERNGRYRVVDYRSSGSQPQVVVVNTCAVTATSAKKSQQLINRVRRENPAALILVMGCWGELIRQQRQFQPAVGDDCRLWYIGNYGKHRLAETLDKLLAGVPETDRPDRRRSVEYDELGYSQFPGRKSRAFVKIQDGCDSGCTYCIIPRLRGNSRSRSAEAILAEVGNAVARGYGEVVITGINIGQYYDHGRDWHLAELLNSICGLPGEFRVRLGSLEVMEISEGLLSMFACPRICPHLHLALQSGCDRILQRMGRNYTRRAVKDLLAKICRQRPDMVFTADLIVGFPGESHRQFMATLELVRELGLAGCHVFPFSPREGTVAATLDGQIPDVIIRERAKQLQKVADWARAEVWRRQVGNYRQVLLENVSGGIGTGYANNYIQTRVMDARPEWLGKLIDVMVIGVDDGGLVARAD